MLYSVLTPRNGSPFWKILNDRGEIVYSGSHQQCEEWLDLADLREATRSQPTAHVTDRVLTRLPLFELAATLLRRSWDDFAAKCETKSNRRRSS